MHPSPALLLQAGDEAAAEAELEGIWRSLDANRHKQLPSPLKQSFSKQSSLLFLSRFQAGKNERV